MDSEDRPQTTHDTQAKRMTRELSSKVCRREAHFIIHHRSSCGLAAGRNCCSTTTSDLWLLVATTAHVRGDRGDTKWASQPQDPGKDNRPQKGVGRIKGRFARSTLSPRCQPLTPDDPQSCVHTRGRCRTISSTTEDSGEDQTPLFGRWRVYLWRRARTWGRGQGVVDRPAKTPPFWRRMVGGWAGETGASSFFNRPHVLHAGCYRLLLAEFFY